MVLGSVEDMMILVKLHQDKFLKYKIKYDETFIKIYPIICLFFIKKIKIVIFSNLLQNLKYLII